MFRDNLMEVTLVSLLFEIMLIIAGNAVNPGCECLLFSGTYGKEFGTFSSPDFPSQYHDNINCLLYTFIAGRDQIIEITFEKFDIHKTQMDCTRGDFLKLFMHIDAAEINEYTPWTSTLCGSYSDIPHVIYSSGSYLVLEFHTDRIKNNNSGFFGHFRFIDKRKFHTDGQKLPGTMCDYQFVSSNYSLTHGRFYSPRYPSSYPKNIKCSYKFRGRVKERIRIVFEEVTLEKGDLSCLNRADLIRVYDGRDSHSPAITVLCNEISETEVLSTGPDIYIEFVANSDSPGQGFKACFQFQPVESTTNDNLSSERERSYNNLGHNDRYSNDIGPAVSATTSTCDEVISSDTSKNGSISSPGYPTPYPPKSYCHYDFKGRGKERLQIIFSDFNLHHINEVPKECDSIDALEAFVHIDGRMDKIDSYCGSKKPKPLMSNGPRLKLEFRGIHSSSSSKGFKATYSFTENFGITSGDQLPEYPCAFVYNSNRTKNGTFTSPNYPGFYPRDTECHYFFHGGSDEKVRLHFTYFDVEGVHPCEALSASDYVEFSNFMAKDRKYSRHCGMKDKFHIESDRKFFRVTFRSNDRLDGTGFHASYQFLNKEDFLSTIKPVSDASMSISRVTLSSNILSSVVVLLLLLKDSG